MSKYAIYNPALSSPIPVSGWMDTDMISYPTMPPADTLLLLTDAEWAATRTDLNGWAVDLSTSPASLVAYVPVITISTAQQALNNMYNGVNITSTSTPALNGLYACDDAAQAKFDRVSHFVVVNGRFPGSSSEMVWPLFNQTSTVVFTDISKFQEVATAVADYVADLYAVAITNVIPPNSKTIP